MSSNNVRTDTKFIGNIKNMQIFMNFDDLSSSGTNLKVMCLQVKGAVLYQQQHKSQFA